MVNLMAFESRLRMIWRSRMGSPRPVAGTSDATRWINDSPFFVASGLTIATASFTVVATLNACSAISSWPASILERSRMSLMRLSNKLPDVQAWRK